MVAESTEAGPETPEGERNVFANVADTPDWFQTPPASPQDRFQFDLDLAIDDFRNFYSWPNLGLVALGIGAAAPIANTTADRDIRQWYQNHVSSKSMDPAATTFNYAGQVWVAVPIGLEAAALLGTWPQSDPTDGCFFEWANRSLRATAVGFPTVLSLYVILGSSRPDRNDSRWHPFNDVHGVSGHTFVGAIPFLTAAAMTDNPWYQAPLVAGSFLTGWARLHEDRHYFSQMALGWWLAYLSVRSVSETQAEQRSYSILPTVTPDGVGVALEVRY
jgi:hypothetical protein